MTAIQAKPVTPVRVTDVYGDKWWVSAEDLASKRILLPLRNRKGICLTDTPTGQRALRRGDAVSIHRDNIAGQANAHILDFYKYRASLVEVPIRQEGERLTW